MDTSGSSSARLIASLRRGPLGESRVSGATLGPYVVHSLIARGGMGAVFRAVNRRTGTPAALKVLLPGHHAPERQRKRFLREAELAAKLDHPGIVRVLDFGEEDGYPWLAMEYVEGRTLDTIQEGARLRAFVKLMAKIARSVGYAHEHGVIHRDLKPANILVREEDGAPLVTDFGVARDVNLASSLTKTGAMVGTPAFMAPEQSAGQETGRATDVHALGAILYEGLAQRQPFDASHGLVALHHAIEKEMPEPPSAYNPGLVPEALDRVCLKALAKKPEDRYPDGDAFADELEAWLEGRQLSVSRSRLVPLAILAGVALGVAGVLVAVAVGRDTGPGPAPEPRVAVATPSPTSPAVAPAPATHTLVLQPGPIEGQDTYVRNDGWYNNDNFGLHPSLYLGDRAKQRGDFRIYLRFDLSRLPPDAEVERATLAVWVNGTGELERPLQVEVHRAVATHDKNGQGRHQTPWAEGTSLVDDLLDGMCWDGDPPEGRYPQQRSNRADLTQPDVDERALARALVSRETARSWLELEVGPAVAEWLRDPAANLGLCFAHVPEGPPWDDGKVQVFSSDHRDALLRPKLTVVYRGAPPRDPEVDPTALREQHRDQAGALLRQVTREDGVPSDRARAAAQRAVELAPFWGRALFVRGRLLASTHPHQAAADLRVASMSAEPYREPELFDLRGRLRFKLGSREAAGDLAKAREHSPADADLAVYHAVALRGLKKVPEAVDELTRFLETYGESAPWIVPYELCADLLLLDRAGEAERRAREALRRFGGKQPKLLEILAAALATQERDAEAEAELQKALAITPNSGEALGLLARIRLRNGDPARAIALARRALAADPEDVEAVLILSSALEASGDRAGARRAIEEALRRRPPRALEAILRKRYDALR